MWLLILASRSRKHSSDDSQEPPPRAAGPPSNAKSRGAGIRHEVPHAIAVRSEEVIDRPTPDR
jgi:hypothetical protein